MEQKLIASRSSYHNDTRNDHGNENMMLTRIIEPLKDHVWRPPYFTNVHLTNRTCSLNCKFCIKGSSFVEEKLITDPMLLASTMHSLLGLNSDNGTYWINEFHFDGDSSDPLMPRSIPTLAEAVHMIKSFPFGPKRRVEIITNGVNLMDERFRLLLPHIDLINVSLNATTAKEHADISGRDGQFETIVKGIETLGTDISLFRFNTQINVSHVISRLRDGTLNLGKAEDMAARLARYGVKKYLFRFDLRGESSFVKKDVRKRLEAAERNSPLDLLVKPVEDTHYHDSCVAPLLWLNMLPNGLYGKGCAHNLNAVSAAEHYEKKALTPSDLAMICHKHCPSFMGLQNDIYHEQRRTFLNGFEAKYSELLSALFGNPGDRTALPKEESLFEDIHDIDMPRLLGVARQSGDDLLLGPISTVMQQADRTLGTVSKNDLFITDQFGTITGISFKKLSEYFGMEYCKESKKRHETDSLKLRDLVWQPFFTLGNGNIVVKDMRSMPTERHTSWVMFDLPRQRKDILPVIMVKHVEKKGQNTFPPHIRNGIELLADRARYFSSYKLPWQPLAGEYIDFLNQEISEGNAVLDLNEVDTYLNRLAQVLHAYMLEMDAPVDTLELRPIQRIDLAGTILDFDHFLKKNDRAVPGAYFQHKWFTPENILTGDTLQYLFWMKCFGRHALFLQGTYPKLTTGSWSIRLLVAATLTAIYYKKSTAPPYSILKALLNTTYDKTTQWLSLLRETARPILEE